jgi:integral membrane sensor domain MASE1
MLSMVKSIVDVLPDVDILRFIVINGLGAIIFISSLYLSKDVTDSKTLWFINGFTGAGLILIVYSSSIEIQGAIHEMAIPIIHIIEVIIVVWLGNKMIRDDEKERYTELTHFGSSQSTKT